MDALIEVARDTGFTTHMQQLGLKEGVIVQNESPADFGNSYPYKWVQWSFIITQL
jgi:hypothetical protein